MNKPAWFFGTTSVLLSGLCISLLRREPAQAAPQARPDEILQAQLTQARAERDQLETVVNSLRTAPVGAAATPPPIAANPTPQPMAPTRIDLPPQTRRLSLRLRNGKIFKELGLSDAQIESVLDVLTAQEARASTFKIGAPAPNADPELRARNRAEVAAVIGDERARQLEAWHNQSYSRFELQRVRDQLDESGEPLSDAQQKRMSELVLTEQATPSPTRNKDETPEAFMSRLSAWRNDRRDQLRKHVSSVLEPRQLARYEEMNEVSREYEKAMPMRMPMLQAPPAAGQAAPPPPLR